MLPIHTPAVRARLLGQSDGFTGHQSQAAKYTNANERAAYEAAFEKHRKLKLEEERRWAT
jgi:hypothetical protein